MSGYNEVTVVVNGALDSETIWHTDDGLAAFVQSELRSGRIHGHTVEVHVRHHDHDHDVEDCACAQYETDHHPTYAYRPSDDCGHADHADAACLCFDR